MIRAALAVGLASGLSLLALPAHADVTGSGPSQGITVQTDPKVRLDSIATKQVFCDMRTIGANTVVLHIPLQQAGIHATKVERRPNRGHGAYTPSDSELVWAIRHAKQCGMLVVLKPTAELPHSEKYPNGEWRSHITFSDNQDALSKKWHESWRSWMVHYAKVAKAEGVTTLSVGTEMIGVTLDKCSTDSDIPKGVWSCNKNNGTRWVETIKAVRKAAPKVNVTYAAYRGSWNRPKESTLLPTKMVKELNTIGVTYYPSNYAQMKKDVKTYFDPMWKRYGKPIEFQESGFRASKGEAMQARDTRDLLRLADDLGHVGGLWYFRWANSRASVKDVDFTTQRRAADVELAKAFGGKVPR